MERKVCTFYQLIGDEPYTINAWIEGNKIYTALGERPSGVLDVSENFFYSTPKGGGICVPNENLAEYRGPVGNMRILFELDKKWGYGNPWSNHIFIAPTYDFAWPFQSNDCAVVCMGGVYSDAAYWLNPMDAYSMQEGGGRYGLIDSNGTPVIPLAYDVLKHIAFEDRSPEAVQRQLVDYHHYYLAKKENNWGAFDAENKLRIPIVWDDLYVYEDWFLIGEKFVSPPFGTGLNITLFDQELQQIADHLDYEPLFCPCHGYPMVDEEDISQYYLLQKDEQYGFVRNDGVLIAPIQLSEEDARAQLWKLGRTWI